MPSLPTLPNSPATGDPGQASWADNVAAWIAFLASGPVFVGYQGSSQSITNNTTTGVTIDTEVADTANGHDLVTNNSRYIAQYSGWYRVDLRIGYPTAASGRALIGYGVNSSTFVAESFSPLNSAQSTGLTLSDDVFLTAGDYVVFLTSQNSGGTLTLVSHASAPRSTGMCVSWIHA